MNIYSKEITNVDPIIADNGSKNDPNKNSGITLEPKTITTDADV